MRLLEGLGRFLDPLRLLRSPCLWKLIEAVLGAPGIHIGQTPWAVKSLDSADPPHLYGDSLKGPRPGGGAAPVKLQPLSPPRFSFDYHCF